MKYGNVKTNGYSSKKEAARAQELELLERAGRIRMLQKQVAYTLAAGCVINGRKRPPMRYVADFTYTDDKGKVIVEDVKGFKTPVYKLKRHLMMALLGIEILET